MAFLFVLQYVKLILNFMMLMRSKIRRMTSKNIETIFHKIHCKA